MAFGVGLFWGQVCPFFRGGLDPFPTPFGFRYCKRSHSLFGLLSGNSETRRESLDGGTSGPLPVASEALLLATSTCSSFRQSTQPKKHYIRVCTSCTFSRLWLFVALRCTYKCSQYSCCVEQLTQSNLSGFLRYAASACVHSHQRDACVNASSATGLQEDRGKNHRGESKNDYRQRVAERSFNSALRRANSESFKSALRRAVSESDLPTRSHVC